MKTIATINFKGGVGKTTVTWCLGDVLSQRADSNILLFDLDAQASLTQSIEFGQQHDEFTLWKKNSEEQKNTIHAALDQFLHQTGKFKFQPDENFIYQINSKYHFVPATSDLYWVGLNALDPEKGRVFIRRVLEKIKNSPDLPEYDYVIFDCPPSFTPLSYSVLTCCDLVLIPTNSDFFAAKGIDLLANGLRNKIELHPFPKTVVFANRVGGRRETAGVGEIQPFGMDKFYMKRIRTACTEARQKKRIDIHFLETWLPDRAAIKKAINMRETPEEFLEHFDRLWSEIEEMMK